MNANHVYIIIGIAAISALLTTVALYMMEIENTAIVAGVSGTCTLGSIVLLVRKNKK